ncbi:MAG: hypothetical protein IKS74_05115 [Methanomicrobium sp.]|nr:hypothetical protein [Methanomicrobium sp.]
MKKPPDYGNIDVSARIDDRIHSERNRKILKRRFIDGIRFEPLGEEFGLSTTQVKRIVLRDAKIIFK